MTDKVFRTLLELPLAMICHYCKSPFLGMLFLACVISSKAQDPQHKIDSLRAALVIAKEDTNKIIALVALGDQLTRQADYEPAKKYIEEAMQLSEKLNYQKGISDALNIKGYLQWNQGDFDEALINYQRALKIKESIGDKKGQARAYSGIGLIYLNQGKYAEAMENNQTALRIKQEIKDTDVGSILFNMAITHISQGNYPDALQLLYEAQQSFTRTGDKRGLAFVYMNIGHIDQVQNKPQEAIKNIQVALGIAEEIRNKKIEQACHNNLAIMYSDMNDNDQAISHYLQALEIAKSLGAKREISIAHGNIGAIYFVQGEYNQALKNYRAALPIAEEMGDQENVANINNNIGKTYLVQGDYSDANSYLLKGYALAKEIGAKQVLKESLEGLTELEEKLGHYRQALDYQRLLYTYKDSLLNESNSQLLTELQTKYEAEKKEKEIALLTKDKEIQRIAINKQTLLKEYFMIGLALALLVFLLMYNNYRIKQKVKLEAIRNNIAADLHDDIGSTLNSISLFSEVAKHEAGKPIPALEEIGVSARRIIDAMSDIVWTINPENDTFENVISRMRSSAYLMLKAKGIEFVFKADENLNQLSLPMLARKNIYLLFKEAVTNIVKHSNASKATFRLSLENKNIKLFIQDNGLSFDINQFQMGNGIKNMKRRAAEIGAQLAIESGNGHGTTIELNYKP